MPTGPIQPAIHFSDTSKEATGGLRLIRLLFTDTAAQDGTANLTADFYRRSMQWLDTLTGLSGKKHPSVTFRLQFLIAEYPEGHRSLRVCLLVSKSGKQPEKTAASLLTYLMDLKVLLNLFHPEGEWELITDPQELTRFLTPFKPFQVVEIGQRTGYLTLSESIQGEPSVIGFKAEAPPQLPAGSLSIPVIFPFQLTMNGWSAICSYLLAHQGSFLLRIQLSPVTLTDQERLFYNEQYTFLNALAQGYQGSPHSQVVFSQELQTALKYLSDNRMTFTDQVFDVRMHLFSDQEVSVITGDLLGSSVSSSVSISEDGFSGGYDLVIRGAGDRSGIDSMSPPCLLNQPKNRSHRRLRYLMNSKTAIAAFHLPFSKAGTFPGLEASYISQSLSQRAFSEGTQLLALDPHQPQTAAVHIQHDDRYRHFYTVGQTGTGKSTFLEHQIMQDINAGRGVGLIDPHGDLFARVLTKIPPERLKDVVLIDPSQPDSLPIINILEFRDQRERQFIIQDFIRIIEQLFDERYKTEVTGPIFYHYLRMFLLLITTNPDKQSTVMDLYKVFSEEDYYKRFDYKEGEKKTGARDSDLLDSFMKSETFNFKRGSETPFSSYFISKFDNFLADPITRSIMTGRESTIRFDEVLNNRKILLVNLSSAFLGEINSRFLGMLIMSKLQLAVMRRASIPVEDRTDFFLYVDEFQKIATSSFSQLLAEARKYRLSLILANQFTSQLQEMIWEAIKGNVGNLLIFRVGMEDAAQLEPLVFPSFNRSQLIRIPNWSGILKVLRNGSVENPFYVETLQDKSPVFPETPGLIAAASKREILPFSEDQLGITAEFACGLVKNKNKSLISEELLRYKLTQDPERSLLWKVVLIAHLLNLSERTKALLVLDEIATLPDTGPDVPSAFKECLVKAALELMDNKDHSSKTDWLQLISRLYPDLTQLTEDQQLDVLLASIKQYPDHAGRLNWFARACLLVQNRISEEKQEESSFSFIQPYFSLLLTFMNLIKEEYPEVDQLQFYSRVIHPFFARFEKEKVPFSELSYLMALAYLSSLHNTRKTKPVQNPLLAESDRSVTDQFLAHFIHAVPNTNRINWTGVDGGSILEKTDTFIRSFLMQGPNIHVAVPALFSQFNIAIGEKKDLLINHHHVAMPYFPLITNLFRELQRKGETPPDDFPLQTARLGLYLMENHPGENSWLPVLTASMDLILSDSSLSDERTAVLKRINLVLEWGIAPDELTETMAKTIHSLRQLIQDLHNRLPDETEARTYRELHTAISEQWPPLR